MCGLDFVGVVLVNFTTSIHLQCLLTIGTCRDVCSSCIINFVIILLIKLCCHRVPQSLQYLGLLDYSQELKSVVKQGIRHYDC